MTAPCATKIYQKSDGNYYCGFIIKDSLNWYQADDICKRRGGKLPEVYDEDNNMEILKFKVSFSISTFNLLRCHSQDHLSCNLSRIYVVV
jgi:hypothetical protein